MLRATQRPPCTEVKCARRRHRHPQRSRMSHMERADRQRPGRPARGGGCTRGEAAITVGTEYKGHVHKHHVPSRGQQATTARTYVSGLRRTVSNVSLYGYVRSYVDKPHPSAVPTTTSPAESIVNRYPQATEQALLTSIK